MPAITFEKIKSAENQEKQEEKLAEKLGGSNHIFSLKCGDYIIATEKIDGANASVYHNDKDELEVYSRHEKLNEHNTLNNFYNFIMERKDELLKAIPMGTQVFGEWLTSHVVKYKPEYYCKWYLYDMVSESEFNGAKALCYAGYKATAKQSSLLVIKDIEVAPLLYEGSFEFSNLKEVDLFRDKLIASSKMSLDGHAEGVVITDLNIPLLADGNGVYHRYRIKDVDEAYRETIKISNKKVLDPDLQMLYSYVGKGLALARVRKVYLKLRDENKIDGDISFSWFKDGKSKLISEEVLKDIKEELPDKPSEELFDEYSEEVQRYVGKKVNKFIALTIKELI